MRHNTVTSMLIPAACIALALLAARLAPQRSLAAEPARRPARAPQPYVVKTAAELGALEKTLQGPGGRGADLVKPGNVAVEAVWRHDEDVPLKELEVHDGKDHLFYVTEGRATFTLGGELTEPREISPGEWRAARVSGADSVEVTKGDLVFIPHGVVHGRSTKGGRFTMLQVSFWPGGAPPPKK